MFPPDIVLYSIQCRHVDDDMLHTGPGHELEPLCVSHQLPYQRFLHLKNKYFKILLKIFIKLLYPSMCCVCFYQEENINQVRQLVENDLKGVDLKTRMIFFRQSIIGEARQSLDPIVNIAATFLSIFLLGCSSPG